MPKTLILSLAVAAVVLSGCAQNATRVAEADNQQYVCKPGSAVRYRKERVENWPGVWIPAGPGGTCKTYTRRATSTRSIPITSN